MEEQQTIIENLTQDTIEKVVIYDYPSMVPIEVLSRTEAEKSYNNIIGEIFNGEISFYNDTEEDFDYDFIENYDDDD